MTNHDILSLVSKWFNRLCETNSPCKTPYIFHFLIILEWVESPSNHTILKDEDVSMIREGEWKRLNTLGHYQVPDGTCLRLVRRFASAFDTSGELNGDVVLLIEGCNISCCSSIYISFMLFNVHGQKR